MILSEFHGFPLTFEFASLIFLISICHFISHHLKESLLSMSSRRCSVFDIRSPIFVFLFIKLIKHFPFHLCCFIAGLIVVRKISRQFIISSKYQFHFAKYSFDIHLSAIVDKWGNKSRAMQSERIWECNSKYRCSFCKLQHTTCDLSFLIYPFGVKRPAIHFYYADV